MDWPRNFTINLVPTLVASSHTYIYLLFFNICRLIRLINTNGADLLVNVSRGLGACANDRDALERMRKLDGVRLLWSLLKHPSEKVQVCNMKLFVFEKC